MRPVLLLRHLHFVEMECIHLAVLEMQQIIIGEKHSFSDKNKFKSKKYNVASKPISRQGKNIQHRQNFFLDLEQSPLRFHESPLPVLIIIVLMHKEHNDSQVFQLLLHTNCET